MARFAFPRLGKPPPAVPHGFRSTFRDWAAEETNYPREVVQAALARLREAARVAMPPVGRRQAAREAGCRDGVRRVNPLSRLLRCRSSRSGDSPATAANEAWHGRTPASIHP